MKNKISTFLISMVLLSYAFGAHAAAGGPPPPPLPLPGSLGAGGNPPTGRAGLLGAINAGGFQLRKATTNHKSAPQTGSGAAASSSGAAASTTSSASRATATPGTRPVIDPSSITGVKLRKTSQASSAAAPASAPSSSGGIPVKLKPVVTTPSQPAAGPAHSGSIPPGGVSVMLPQGKKPIPAPKPTPAVKPTPAPSQPAAAASGTSSSLENIFAKAFGNMTLTGASAAATDDDDDDDSAFAVPVTHHNTSSQAKAPVLSQQELATLSQETIRERINTLRKKLTAHTIKCTALSNRRKPIATDYQQLTSLPTKDRPRDFSEQRNAFEERLQLLDAEINAIVQEKLKLDKEMDAYTAYIIEQRNLEQNRQGKEALDLLERELNNFETALASIDQSSAEYKTFKDRLESLKNAKNHIKNEAGKQRASTDKNPNSAESEKNYFGDPEVYKKLLLQLNAEKPGANPSDIATWKAMQKTNVSKSNMAQAIHAKLQKKVRQPSESEDDDEPYDDKWLDEDDNTPAAKKSTTTGTVMGDDDDWGTTPKGKQAPAAVPALPGKLKIDKKSAVAALFGSGATPGARPLLPPHIASPTPTSTPLPTLIKPVLDTTAQTAFVDEIFPFLASQNNYSLSALADNIETPETADLIYQLLAQLNFPTTDAAIDFIRQGLRDTVTMQVSSGVRLLPPPMHIPAFLTGGPIGAVASDEDVLENYIYENMILATQQLDESSFDEIMDILQQEAVNGTFGALALDESTVRNAITRARRR